MVLYHYTNGTKIKKIVSSGIIKTTPERPMPREKPVCWLSSNPRWEKTANKISDTGGELRLLNQIETEEFCDGLYRLVVPHSAELSQWPKIAIEARIPSKLKKILVKRAKRAGIDTSQWFGTLQPIPANGLVIERLNNNVWAEVTPNEIMNMPSSSRMTKYAYEGEVNEEDWNKI